MQTLTKLAGFNAYVYTPEGYDGKTKMPWLLATPGNGEVGSDPTQMNKYLPCKFIAAGYNPNMVVICIQPPGMWPTTDWLKSIYDAVVNSYAVDTARLYLSGYSAGGTVSDAFALKYPSLVAAVFSLSSPAITSGPVDAPLYQPWAKSGGNLWALTGGNDNSNGFGMIVASMNSIRNGSAIYTEIPGMGHCCWDTYYNPSYKLNGLNWENWLLQYSLSGLVTQLPPIGAIPQPKTIKSLVINYTDGSQLTLP